MGYSFSANHDITVAHHLLMASNNDLKVQIKMRFNQLSVQSIKPDILQVEHEKFTLYSHAQNF